MPRATMIPVSDAAILIGCSQSHVRHMVRTGKIRASLQKVGRMTYYEVNKSDAIRIRDTPQKLGYPRGQKRGEKS